MEIEIIKSEKVDSYFNDSEIELLVKTIKIETESKKETLKKIEFCVFLHSPNILDCQITTTTTFDSYSDLSLGTLYAKPFYFFPLSINIQAKEKKIKILRHSDTYIEYLHRIRKNLTI